MRVWDSIKTWGAKLLQRTATATGIAREFKDIFELGGVPAFSQFYYYGVFIWKYLYRGLYKPWHVVPVTAVGAKPNETRQMFRLNTAKAVSAELASLVWGEECQFSVSTAGWTEEVNEDGVIINPDPLKGFIDDVLRKNAFGEKLQELIEQGMALGGAAIKVWHDVRRDREGNEIPNSGAIRLGYCMADQFVPIAWDNAQITEGVFISRRARKGWYYTRLEWHRWDGETYTITNELYKADMQRGANAGENQDILGIRCPTAEMAELFPGLEPETVIPVEESLFSYFRTPIANNIDDNSPLGVSIYANALETLHAIDICYDSFVTEFRLGRKKIIVPARFLRAVVDPQTGRQVRYFDPSDETYVGVADDDGTAGIHDISVELRVEEHVAALNALLSILCLQIGFSATTFSFDAQSGLKTATEVVSENSKTYKTIKTVQNQLRPMLEHMVRNIIDVAILYGMEWQGQSVESLAAGGYEVKITFDDGVTQDRQTNLNEGVMLVNSGLLSKFTFLTDRKYGQGMTEKDALAELERIRQEKQTTIDETQVRLFGGGA
jgi:A118 family predicted phage portal protein